MPEGTIKTPSSVILGKMHRHVCFGSAESSMWVDSIGNTKLRHRTVCCIPCLQAPPHPVPYLGARTGFLIKTSQQNKIPTAQCTWDRCQPLRPRALMLKDHEAVSQVLLARLEVSKYLNSAADAIRNSFQMRNLHTLGTQCPRISDL